MNIARRILRWFEDWLHGTGPPEEPRWYIPARPRRSDGPADWGTTPSPNPTVVDGRVVAENTSNDMY